MKFDYNKRMRIPVCYRCLIILLISALFPHSTEAQQQKFSAADIDFFEKKVRPLLVEKCLECHGDDPDDIQGGLRLTSRAEILSGGDSGPAIVPGKPKQSLLVDCINYGKYEMPPDEKMSAAEIAIFVKWIEMGAPDPRDASGKSARQKIDMAQARKHWSYQIPKRPAMPLPKNVAWPKSNIDRFILLKLEQQKIEPVKLADRTTILRRAYTTLIGLPPTVQQIDQFVKDPLPFDQAFANVVDQLLASKHFGERWGRHWLDVARFAESSGGGRSLMFPHAWRYRDYVIQAYNEDRRYDQFIREQIAGDLLTASNDRERAKQITGTGFLALGPTNYEQQDKEFLRMDVIDEQIDTIGRAFMGLTIGCARCHDHKFDPISTQDYYALVGIFKSTESLVDGNVSSYVTTSISPMRDKIERDLHLKKIEVAKIKLEQYKDKLRKLGGDPETLLAGKPRKKRTGKPLGIVVDNRAAKTMGVWKSSRHVKNFLGQDYVHDIDQGKGKKSAVFEPKLRRGGKYEVRMSYTAGGNRASNVPVTIDHQDGKKIVYVNQSKNPPIDGQFISLGQYRFEADNVASVTISNKNTDGHVIVDAIQFIPVGLLARQNKTKQGRPSGKNKKNKKAITPFDDEPKSTELQVAEAAVKSFDKMLRELKKNPPKPRDIAMSVGERKTVDSPVHIRGHVRNVGKTAVPRGFLTVCSPVGAKHQLPKNQSGRLELANWIADAKHPLTARVYVNRVWRHLFGVGLVATTDNFGVMGTKPSHPELLDHLACQFVADGWSTKKLIRRIMLSRVYQLSTDHNERASKIDPENRLLWRANRRRVDVEVLRDSVLMIAGQLDLKAGGRTIRKITAYDLGYKFNTNRRSVYVPAFRNSMLDFFETFDGPNPNLVTGHRNTSTLPTQALFLLNNPKIIEMSRAAAEKMLSENRNRSIEEKTIATYRKTLGRYPTKAEIRQAEQFITKFQPENKQQAEREAWSSFIHALFASIEFRYID